MIIGRRGAIVAASFLFAGAIGACRLNVPDALTAPAPPAPTLTSDLDHIFDDPLLARALVGVRVDALDASGTSTPRTIYARHANTLAVPASNLKLLTLAVAATRLGWNATFETRLEAVGAVADGTLDGDLVVVGGGDPSIAGQDFDQSPLFVEWADALKRAGIRRVEGRIVADTRAFEGDGLGAGWSWDYLVDGYAAPASALSYNENVVVVRVWPGQTAGEPARVDLSPAGHALTLDASVRTGDASTTEASIDLARDPGSPILRVRGSVPAGGATIVRTAAVPDPPRFFVEGLRLALQARGITITDAGDGPPKEAAAPASKPAARIVIATHRSLPLSSLAEYCLKESQNFYAEMFLRAIGRTPTEPGSVERGRATVRDTLASWNVPPDAYVMRDGSGLSRGDYASADAIVAVLDHVWQDERLRGPFLAALPVAGHDGTLASRMKGTALDDRVQGKTGTLANVRALSGYLETTRGQKLAFSILVNNFTAPSVQIDAVVEKALARLGAD